MPTATLISLLVIGGFFVVQIVCDILAVPQTTSLDEEPKTLANRQRRNDWHPDDGRVYRPPSLEQIVAAIHRADAPPPLRAIASERW